MFKGTKRADWIGWVKCVVRAPQSCTALIVGWERPVDGFKLQEAQVAFRTVPPDKHFGGKGRKRLIKGL